MNGPADDRLEDSMIVSSRPKRSEQPTGFRLSIAALDALGRGEAPLRDADFRSSPRRFLGIGLASIAGAWRDPAVDIVDPRIPRVNESRTTSSGPAASEHQSSADASPW